MVVLGSSPRMRGTLGHRGGRGAPPGIIPAHAGNTSFDMIGDVQPRDHPRACGEHQYDIPYCKTVQGSSPRMRGTLIVDPRQRSLLGIIPAHAGNTG